MDTVVAFVLLLIRSVLANVDLVLLLVGFQTMAFLAKRRGMANGLDGGSVADLSFWLAVAAAVGGRLAYVAPNIDSYLSRPLDLLRISSGMWFYGAVAAGLLVGAWYARRRHLPLWVTSDLYGLYLPVAVVISRAGCLLYNGCYGRQAAAPLGIVFPGLTQPRFPSELYEALLALLLFGVLLWLAQRPLKSGVLFLGFLAAYSAARTLVDLTRIDIGGVMRTTDLATSLGVAMAGAVGLYWRVKRPLTVADGPLLTSRLKGRAGVDPQAGGRRGPAIGKRQNGGRDG